LPPYLEKTLSNIKGSKAKEKAREVAARGRKLSLTTIIKRLKKNVALGIAKKIDEVNLSLWENTSFNEKVNKGEDDSLKKV
jgi:hypothetical protein